MAHIVTGMKFYSLLITAYFTLSTGFVLSSSAARSNSYISNFVPGEKLVYSWKSTTVMNENFGNTKNIGFELEGKVWVSTLWGNGQHRILKIELNEPQLQAKSVSRKNEKSTSLKNYQSHPFLLLLNNGIVDKLFIVKNEETALKNVQKGLASLIKFQNHAVQEDTETDASGRCKISYISDSTMNKIKTECDYDDLDTFKHLDEILGVNVVSSRVTKYTASDSNNLVRSIKQLEKHTIHMQSKLELGALIEASQDLTYEQTLNCDKISSSNVDDAISQILASESPNLHEESLVTYTEPSLKSNEKKQFNRKVATLRGQIKTDLIGSVKSAKALLPLLEIARVSNSEDISEALSDKKNERILPQLYDILGHAQTQNTHTAVMKHLHLDSEAHTDLIEKYLWALSFSVHPNIEILEDLLTKYSKYFEIPEKTSATLILTIASLARTLSQSKKQDYDRLKILKKVEETIINDFDYAKGSKRYVFLNALKNLQSSSTLPKLTSILQNGTLKEEVLAWKAIKSFGKNYWTPEILKRAERTLFQLDKKHDVSSRTLAADLILGAEPSDSTLEALLHFVASNSTYEVRQYVFQSIKMLSDKCERFSQRVSNIIRSNKNLNNYSALAPKGLSTALIRTVFDGNAVNGSLVSIQEIKSGIVKRGVVDVVLTKNQISKDLFTLGIFAGGLSSLVSNDKDEDADDESATAGMELTVLGTQIRPFVFFDGQGELMGHVWSGTASEMTPAFQALILTQDHREYLRLGNGFIVEIDLKGSVSFDLSGKIEVSIWNRNAQSLIKKSVGYVTKGHIRVNAPFAWSQIDFESSIEPKLSLEIDSDFSGDVKLCMRLSQPISSYRLKVNKSEAVPERKHHFKLNTSRRKEIPGFTYSLNRKNNEMCSAMFS
ncbi:microsomal triacylglycerol transfer protein isoform X2 [Euwallacea fornicatus]|uniref:microsomal triacylglycerol transfer protein isoform X2 n=1 Tax=Euwallacea fornicatus TaxID=995702 RepID=UPI00338FC657